MQDFSSCPKCSAENVYFDGSLWNCPDCRHDWSVVDGKQSADEAEVKIKGVCDAYGSILSDGDSVTIVKDLKVKGSSTSIKVGTKVKGIRLIDSSDGHNISCKIEGFGAMNLKSEFVKKA